MTETVGIAVCGVSNVTGPQQNQIAINKKQIKVKDFHTLIIQAAELFTIARGSPDEVNAAFLAKLNPCKQLILGNSGNLFS